MSKDIYYGDYLQLDKILSSQSLESAKAGKVAHDETLFIIIHQVYELWFKEILHECDSVINFFSQTNVPEKEIGIANHRMERVNTIFKYLVGQMDILETMKPTDFLEFRDYLTPASGFQSVQFRLLEASLGLKRDWQGVFSKELIVGRLNEADQQKILEAENKTSLLEFVDRWLARTPFLNTPDFNFWKGYQNAVNKFFDKDRQTIQELEGLAQEKKELEIKNLESTRENILSVLDEKKYQKLQESGAVKISHKAMLAALFIHLYKEEPLLRMPYQFLNSLVELDSQMTHWRSRHALMAQRLLGMKIGTGGSSGHKYLKMTIDKSRIFSDFFNLASFLMPHDILPELPRDIKKTLSFTIESN